MHSVLVPLTFYLYTRMPYSLAKDLCPYLYTLNWKNTVDGAEEVPIDMSLVTVVHTKSQTLWNILAFVIPVHLWQDKSGDRGCSQEFLRADRLTYVLQWYTSIHRGMDCMWRLENNFEVLLLTFYYVEIGSLLLFPFLEHTQSRLTKQCHRFFLIYYDFITPLKTHIQIELQDTFNN